MRSVLLALSAIGAVSHASSICTSSTCASTGGEDPDVSSLLQSQSLVRKNKQHAKMTDVEELLEPMQDVANSVATMTPEVNTAIGTANAALQTMLPLLEQQHSLAEQEVRPPGSRSPGFYAFRRGSNSGYVMVDARSLSGFYRIQQKAGLNYVDAYASHGGYDVVAGISQNNPSQWWYLNRVGLTDQVYEIQQVGNDDGTANGRFLDAHEGARYDYSVVTRPEQGDDSQEWKFTLVDTPSGHSAWLPTADSGNAGVNGMTFTIKHAVNMRFLDSNGRSLVTRPEQQDDTQKWVLTPLSPEEAQQARDLMGMSSGCDESQWPDLKHNLVCGDCKVLVNRFNSQYSTCSGYCGTMGRACVGAWEEHSNDCTVESDMTCDEARHTSDAICQCSASVAARM